MPRCLYEEMHTCLTCTCNDLYVHHLCVYIIHCLCVPLHMTMMVVVVRVGFVQNTPYQFPENEPLTIFVGIFTEIVAGRRAIVTATEEGNVHIICYG